MARLASRCVHTSSDLSRTETVNVGSCNKISHLRFCNSRRGPHLGRLQLFAPPRKQGVSARFLCFVSQADSQASCCQTTIAECSSVMLVQSLPCTFPVQSQLLFLVNTLRTSMSFHCSLPLYQSVRHLNMGTEGQRVEPGRYLSGWSPSAQSFSISLSGCLSTNQRKT